MFEKMVVRRENIVKGIHEVIVESKRIHYKFSLRRNLTVIRGDSATGKTTLVDMIQQHIDNPSGSAVSVRCDKSCYVLSGSLWKNTLSGIKDSIVFIDEGNEFVGTNDFADIISKTDNYYVIVTRESLPSLPYSVEEIYGIREAGKYGRLKQTYNELFRIYGAEYYNEKEPDTLVVTEDSNAGYDFFQNVCAQKGMQCKSAGGKSNVFRIAASENRNMLLIADGAAFGPEIDRIMKLIQQKKNITLYLPESFEWLILKSNLFQNKSLNQMLEHPSDYIESGQYFSWERFFTKYLMDISKETYLQYNKRQLNVNYLSEAVEKRVLSAIPDAIKR